MDIQPNFEVTGQNSLDAEFRRFKALLAMSMKKALEQTNADMQEALKRHIESDVYAAYKPLVYERRSENGGMGAPLSDLKTNVGFSDTQVSVEPQGVGAMTQFHFIPTGEHTVSRWHTADGNELIGRIERKNPPYTWGNNSVPERPFWQNFVDEMIDEGGAAEMFERAMTLIAPTLELEADGSIIREPNDGTY